MSSDISWKLVNGCVVCPRTGEWWPKYLGSPESMDTHGKESPSGYFCEVFEGGLVRYNLIDPGDNPIAGESLVVCVNLRLPFS